MRICLVYDCLYPYTVGGAERWYRNLGARARRRPGTRSRTSRGASGPRARRPTCRACAWSRSRACDPLYGEDGRRRIGPPLRFGAGVLRHLLANRGRYDARAPVLVPVLLAARRARAALVGSRVPIGVDWFEVWSRGYWRDYLGPVRRARGRARAAAVRAADPAGLRVLAAARAAPGAVGPAQRADRPRRPLRGADRAGPPGRARARPAGGLRGSSHPGEAAAAHTGRGGRGARARPRACGRWCSGTAPCDRPCSTPSRASRHRRRRRGAGLRRRGGRARRARRATCHVLPSSREGYGLVVIEAAAYGTPTVVVAGDDNAAVELIEPGVNGFVAQRPGRAAGRDRRRCTRAAPSCASAPRAGSPTTPRPSASEPRWRRSSNSLRDERSISESTSIDNPTVYSRIFNK